ncbi:MAG: amidohydrolase [Bacillota bacterium]|nr:amidohydrolase [Bacillota bacterium]
MKRSGLPGGRRWEAGGVETVRMEAEQMRRKGWKRLWLSAFLVVLSVLGLAAAPALAEKAELYPAKQVVLDVLSQPEVMDKYSKISDAIWSYAELGLQEYKSSALLADTLEAAGFQVERGLAGMPTCFVATYGSGKPVIGLLGEFDALAMLSQKAGVAFQDPLVPGAPGHGCTHNTMCTAAAAAAIALKEAMDQFGIPGTIKVFGSPAEETVISRPYMVRAGLFEGVDAVIDNHGGGDFSTGYGISGNGLFSFTVTFHGRTAHSGGNPWNGRSALDAVELMNAGVNMLREHLYFSSRIHYVITEGGEAPNVVPDRATVWYYVRNSDDKLEPDFQKVLNCAKGAALATGCTYDVRVYTAIHQRYNNKAAAELYQKNIELVGMPEWSEEDVAFAKALQKELGVKVTGLKTEVEKLTPPPSVFTGGGSSDVGEVTLIAPCATIRFPATVPGVDSHHWGNVAAGATPIAHKGLIAGAKAIAASALDLLTKPEELAKLRAEFEEQQKKYPYRSYLPEGAEPPLDMYDQLMKKYLPLLEEFSYDPESSEPLMQEYTLAK